MPDVSCVHIAEMVCEFVMKGMLVSKFNRIFQSLVLIFTNFFTFLRFLLTPITFHLLVSLINCSTSEAHWTIPKLHGSLKMEYPVWTQTFFIWK